VRRLLVAVLGHDARCANWAGVRMAFALVRMYTTEVTLMAFALVRMYTTEVTLNEKKH
jgi:hypothetical protein